MPVEKAMNPMSTLQPVNSAPPSQTTITAEFAEPSMPLQAKSSLRSQEGVTDASSGFSFSRLLTEEPGVEGTCWFAKYRDDAGHEAANLLRIIVLLLIAPFYFIALEVTLLRRAASNLIRDAWWFEGELTHTSVLRYPPGKPGQPSVVGEYEAHNFLPNWLMLVEVRGDRMKEWRQITFDEAIKMPLFHRQGYTALSYNMKSGRTLFDRGGGVLLDGAQEEERAGERKYTLRDRRRIAEKYLEEYCRAERCTGLRPNRTEFIWLDEFCLADFRQLSLVHDERRRNALEDSQRSAELGRLADIFASATKVCVFCEAPDCEHTGVNCSWGKRLFTLAEILHARDVEVMKLSDTAQPISSSVVPMPAAAFRQRMLQEAALAGRWHLYAIMQSTINSGSVPWQTAIHSLIVEAIRRDNESGYKKHRFLGKGLNGLLPRRAKLADLKGENGWADLAWLLELNQGFYNTASLAAVCTLGNERSWLGPPIEPCVGNERLDPLAIAYPVGRMEDGEGVPPLNVVGAETIGLHRSLKRDGFGLYRQKDWKVAAAWTRFIGSFGLFLGLIVALATGIGPDIVTKIVLLSWCFPAAAICVQLVVGTMYLEENWVFIDSVTAAEARAMLEKNDARLRNRGCGAEWGYEQLAPVWPSQRSDMKLGAVVDVKTGVVTEAMVTAKPNAVVVLAVHGNGVTSLLLDRPVNNPTKTAIKVGMCSLPPYTLGATVKAGSVVVSG